MPKHAEFDGPVVSLHEVSESVRYGYTAPASLEKNGPKFLRITDIVSQSINWESVPYCAGSTSALEKYRLRLGDIVVARTGATVGHAKQIRASENAVFASYLVRFRVNRAMAEPRFIGHLVESDIYRQYVKSQVGGAAQPNANAKVLGRFSFILPPRRIQRRIADVLSAYDDRIENNRRRIALLERAARLLYRARFACDPTPDAWTRTTAFKVMDIRSGGTPKTTVPEYWDGDIPFFTPKDCTGRVYAESTERTITALGLGNCNSRIYPKDTIFISARGTVGRLNMAQKPMAMNQTCYAVSARPPLNQMFLYFALSESVAQFRNRATGSVFAAIVRDTFKRIPFTVPSASAIEGYTRTVAPILRQTELLSREERECGRARDLLLPRLMSGEITA